MTGSDLIYVYEYMVFLIVWITEVVLNEGWVNKGSDLVMEET